jgi:FkbM family methyltransferase
VDGDAFHAHRAEDCQGDPVELVTEVEGIAVADRAGPNQPASVTEGSPEVFRRFEPWAGEVEPGWTVNWLGVRTRSAIQSVSSGAGAASFVQHTPPTASEDFFEWLAVLESVVESRGRFTMVELGAGWGRWLVNAAAALRQLDPSRDCLLVGLEAEPTHFAWLQQHLRDNGLDPSRHRLIRAAVAAHDGRVRFQQGDPAGWYGQAIELDDPAAKASGPVSRLIRWSRNSIANQLARGSAARRVRRVRAVSLTTLLRQLDRVDLVDADVQGVEADVFEAARDDLAAKVARVHIGTHGPDNHDRIRRLFFELGWECRFDYEGAQSHETPWGPAIFEDGAQSWVNPARLP